MTYGGSVALIVIGAILRFAISYSPASVNLQLVGVILMIAGVIGLVVSLVWMFGRRRGDRHHDQDTDRDRSVRGASLHRATALSRPAGRAAPGPRDGSPSRGPALSAACR